MDDLAFENRNKAYGAFYLRKRYRKHLTVSTLAGISLILFFVSIPYILEFFDQPVAYDGMMEDYIYYEPMANPVDDLPDLAKASLPPPPEVEKPPVVVDSVVKEEKKAEEEKKVLEQEPPKKDTLPSQGLGNGSGTQPGDDTGIYTTIDVYPRFPGGDPARFAFLRTQIKYPEAAIKNGISGVVIVVFVIEKDGTLSKVEINKGIGGGCDEEAIRVVKMMPPWEPGKRSGKPVRVLVKMPIVFRIPAKPGK